jgi:hypothetical protein
MSEEVGVLHAELEEDEEETSTRSSVPALVSVDGSFRATTLHALAAEVGRSCCGREPDGCSALQDPDGNGVAGGAALLGSRC